MLPYTISNYLARHIGDTVNTEHPAFQLAEDQVRQQVHDLLERGKRGSNTVDHYYRKLGEILWDKVGMSRSREGLEEALVEIAELKHGFATNLKLVGPADSLNKMLELAGRVADFIELGELMARDALQRAESCGTHFREEYQTPEGEALRDDAHLHLWARGNITDWDCRPHCIKSR